MLAVKGEVGVWWVAVAVMEGEKRGEKWWVEGGKEMGEDCDGASQGKAEGRSILFCFLDGCFLRW